jgi:LPXTG-site transpeptidase (sortase) family protein
LPRDFWQKSCMQETSPINKLALGLALFVLGFLLIFVKPPVKPTDADTFANEPVTIEGLIKDQDETLHLPTKIIIPNLNIDLTVKKARVIGGYWEVLPDAANWGEGSGLPGRQGNVVIFAHAREGLFLPLKEIKEGMKIYVLTSKEWFNYEVKEIKEVLPDQTDVISPTEDQTLTLYTCSGFADSKRMIVVAKILE